MSAVSPAEAGIDAIAAEEQTLPAGSAIVRSPAARRRSRRGWLGRVPVGLLRIVTTLTFLLLWWGTSHLGLVPELFLPTPEAVAARGLEVWREGFADATLLQHIGASLGRVFVALGFAVALGVPVGLAIGLSPVARGLFDPVIEFIRPIPPLAYLPLVVIWCGIGELTKVLLIFVAVFAPVVIATAAGVASVPDDRVNAARALGANRRQVVTHVIVPNALPAILTGLRIGLGVGWSTLVAAELVAATRGLGFMIQSAAQFLNTDVVVMGIIVIAAIAVGLDALVRWAERILVPWHGKV